MAVTLQRFAVRLSQIIRVQFYGDTLCNLVHRSSAGTTVLRDSRLLHRANALRPALSSVSCSSLDVDCTGFNMFNVYAPCRKFSMSCRDARQARDSPPSGNKMGCCVGKRRMQCRVSCMSAATSATHRNISLHLLSGSRRASVPSGHDRGT